MGAANKSGKTQVYRVLAAFVGANDDAQVTH